MRGSDAPTFVDLMIAGSSMRSIKRGTVSTANGGKTCGLLANSIRHLRAEGLPALLPPAGAGQVIEGDFTVQLVA